MKKRAAVLWLTIMVTSMAAGACGNAGNYKNEKYAADDSNGNAAIYDQVMEDAGMDYGEDMDSGASATDSAADMRSETMELAPEEGGAKTTEETVTAAGAAQNQTQKLIYTYDYTVETKEFDALYQKINQKITQLDGYLERSETNGSAADGVNRQANLTLRIPADKMEQMLTLLDQDSNVTYQSRNSENVTLRYVDMESHLKALRAEQETLLTLLEKADKLEDVIAVQSQLTQVRYEIESYESQLRTYDNLIDYSTLYLTVMEVDRTTTIHSSKKSFFEEIGDRFSDNVYEMGQWLRETGVWLVSSLPVLAPLAAVVIAAFLWLRRKIKNRKRKRSSEETNTTDGE